MSQKFVFTCVDCGKKYSVNRQVMYLCPGQPQTSDRSSPVTANLNLNLNPKPFL